MLTIAATVLLFASTDLAATVGKTFEARDPAKVAALFTPDAGITVVIDPRTGVKRVPDETYVGADAVRDFLDAYLPGWQAELRDAAGDGERASWSWSIASERFRTLGIDKVDVRVAATHRNGQLRSLTLTASPESSLKLIAEIPAANKAIVRSFVTRINAHDYSVLDDVIARAFDQHSFMPMAPGADGLRQFYAEFSKAFPDFKFTLEEVIAEGDLVATRMTARYTHKGDYQGIKATNKAVTVSKFDIFRFAGGKCVAHWDSVDRLGLLQQLGAVPDLPRWSATPGYEGFR